jgi:hypothetical protein
MFGYVIPNQAALDDEAKARYEHLLKLIDMYDK